MGALPAAVQQGPDKGAAFRQLLQEDALFQMKSCLDEPTYDSSELMGWKAVTQSLALGSIVDQDAATLLCSLYRWTVYVISNPGNTGLDHIRVIKYTGDSTQTLANTFSCVEETHPVCTPCRLAWHMAAGTDEGRCMWLYLSGIHYQLIGPMEQMFLMRAAEAIGGNGKHFVLMPQGTCSMQSSCQVCTFHLVECSDGARCAGRAWSACS